MKSTELLKRSTIFVQSPVGAALPDIIRKATVSRSEHHRLVRLPGVVCSLKRFCSVAKGMA